MKRWALVLAFAAAGCSAHPNQAGTPDAGTKRSDAGAGGTTPFFKFDAAMPTCTAPTPPAPTSNAAPEARDCGTASPVSFAQDIRPLLNAHCTGEICHDVTWAGSPNEYQLLVDYPTPECCDGRKRVDPASPDKSYLLQKLRGVDLCAGRKMPLEGTITRAEVARIETWICEGAPNN